jgi:hypothetical protein
MEPNNDELSLIPKIFKYIALTSGILLIAVLCIDISSDIYDNLSPSFPDTSIESIHIDSLGRMLNEEDYYFTTPVIEYKIKDFISYKGNWSSIDQIDFLDNKIGGETSFFISRYYSNLELHREKIIIKFFMFDGKFQDKTICAFAFSYVGRNDTNNETLTMMPNEFNTQIEFRENFERVFDYERINY